MFNVDQSLSYENNKKKIQKFSLSTTTDVKKYVLLCFTFYIRFRRFMTETGRKSARNHFKYLMYEFHWNIFLIAALLFPFGGAFN